jgi:hypothetical protein
MRVHEGRGYLLRTGTDTPYAGWLGARQLDAGASLASAPWEALRTLADLAGLMPGGLALLWNAPTAWITDLGPEVRAGFLKGLGHLPGLTLHVRDQAFGTLLQEPAQVWFHAPGPPSGALGLAWRQGWLGWVPEPGPGWSLPGLGATGTAGPAAPRRPGPTQPPLPRVDGAGADLPGDEEVVPGYLWGEALLPLGALEHLDPEELTAVLGERQGQLEQALSQRIGAEAWPAAVPFLRRRTGWRLAFLGGREFQLAGGSWDRAGEQAATLAERLGATLRCPIHLAVSDDLGAANTLGQQAMWEGLPWRNALPLPPAAPCFTPGLGADPREPGPLATRAAFPAAMAQALTETPVVHLRLPGVPLEGAVAVFLGGLERWPAIRWLPPDLAPPGPFLPGRPWAAARTYPALADPAQVLQPALFDDLE